MKTFCVLFTFLLFVPMAFAQNKPFPEKDIIQGHYIVTLKKAYDPMDVAKDFELAPSYVYKKAINGFAAEFQEDTRKSLLEDERILAVEADKIVRANSSQKALAWGLDRIDQRALPLNNKYETVADGSGVTAYVVDTGIFFAHNEFSGRASLGYDAYGGNGSDCHGHGTHVSGTIGGKNFGVAKNVKLKAVRVLDCYGSGTLSAVLSGIEWVINNRVKPAVANFSLGLNGISESIDTAVGNLINAGVATSIAAGNDNRDACSYSPARVASAMTIGASSNVDAKASFSNLGNCVDWFAPGVDIESAWYTGAEETEVLNGTSMATPHNTGVSALYLEKHPEASHLTVRDALYGLSTKNIITNSNSANNHLLYSIEAAQDNIVPTVKLTAPLDGSRTWRWTFVTMDALATDNVKVKEVQFFVDDKRVCTDITTPYRCGWRMPLFAKSSYMLKAKAFDSAGNEGTSTQVKVYPR